MSQIDLLMKTHTNTHNTHKKGGKKRLIYREYKTPMSVLYFRRFRSILKSGEFDIKIIDSPTKELGFVDYENNAIVLKKSKYPLEETLVHELVHIINPDLNEKSVVEISSLLYEHLDDSRREELTQVINSLS